MVVIDKKDGDGRLGDDCRTLLAAVEYFISFATTVNTIWDVWSSFSIFRLLMLCAVLTLRLQNDRTSIFSLTEKILPFLLPDHVPV